MDFIKAIGRELYAGNTPILLRGFGLGGWFLPEGYMWKLYTKCDRPRKMEAMIENLCGKEYAVAFWEKYLDNYITESDIEFIAKEGFNSIRLPLNARHLYEGRGQQSHLVAKMFDRIDRLIEWCRKYQIYVILDMHGAPGGQTGQNIDDSEADQPSLFIEHHYEEELIFLWKELAKRYKDEAIVAGYDLINEPLPNIFRQYHDQVLPLYRKLIREIRKIDRNHMIILEGVHWATDFSIFDTFSKKEAADNIMLQFHKYWNNPDAESLQGFVGYAEKLNVPLFMGEGGENNCDWYTTVFPLYERLNINWSFWSYKKMNCTNSPITFDVPGDWEELISWIDAKAVISSEKAVTIFDDFLQSIQNVRINERVLHALKREVPVTIPCEAYEEYQISSNRVQGAELRITEPVSLIFENGKTGEVDYRRYGGEEQPEEQNLMIHLYSGDSVNYVFYSKCYEIDIIISADGEGELMLSIDSKEEKICVNTKRDYKAVLITTREKKKCLWISCTAGSIKIDNIYLSFPENQVT